MDTINETKLIISEVSTELLNISMGNYLVYAFILIGILLIILVIQIIVNGINRG
jgi:hypothetical protein